MTPTIYFSFRSPYSWLAYEDIRRHHRNLIDDARWQPFWEPDDDFTRQLAQRGGAFPYVPMSKAKHLYMLQDVRRQSRRRDLDVSWPVDTDMWWEPAHLLWYPATDAGCAQDYVTAVYRARWTSGRDIHNPEAVDRIVREAGLALPAARTIVSDKGIRARALDTLVEIWEKDVFGVPYFLAGRGRYWGIDRLRQFVDALERGATPAPETDAHPSCAADLPAGFDLGHEGGCG